MTVADPENWEVSADNVLMRLALRSGLVAQATVDDRPRRDPRCLQAGRRGGRDLAPLLDDLLWERGPRGPRPHRPGGGELSEPPRPGTPTSIESKASLSPVRIPRAIFDDGDRARPRAELPNEACGLIGGSGRRAQTLYQARNAEASPLRYKLDPEDQFRIRARSRTRRGARRDLPLAHCERRPTRRRPTSTSR